MAGLSEQLKPESFPKFLVMGDTCAAMKIRREQHVLDFDQALSESGFEHHRYFKDGVRKLHDDNGNAIFLNRAGIVVQLYSAESGADVDELELTKSTRKQWPDFDVAEMRAERAEEEAEKYRRLNALKDPWDQMTASLPSLLGASSELVQAVRDARHELEFCCVWLEDSIADGDNPLGTAHEALDSIKKLAPEANVSELLKLIVITGQHLQKR